MDTNDRGDDPFDEFFKEAFRDFGRTFEVVLSPEEFFSRRENEGGHHPFGFFVPEDLERIDSFFGDPFFLRDSIPRELLDPDDPRGGGGGPAAGLPAIESLGLPRHDRRVFLTEDRDAPREGSGTVFDRVREKLFGLFNANDRTSVPSHGGPGSPPLPPEDGPLTHPGRPGFLSPFDRPFLPDDDFGAEAKHPPRRSMKYTTIVMTSRNGVTETKTTVRDEHGERTTVTRNGEEVQPWDQDATPLDLIPGQPGGGFSGVVDQLGGGFQDLAADVRNVEQGMHGVFKKFFGLFGLVNDQGGYSQTPAMPQQEQRPVPGSLDSLWHESPSSPR